MPESELNGYVRSKTLLELEKLRRYIILHWDQPETEWGISVKTLSQRFASSPSLSAIREYAFGGKDSNGSGTTVRPLERQRPDGHVYDYNSLDQSGIVRHSNSCYTKNIFLICIGLITFVGLVLIIYILHVYNINL